VATLPELYEINDGYPFAVQYREIEQMLRDRQIPVIELVEGLRGHGPESSLWVTRRRPPQRQGQYADRGADFAAGFSVCVPKQRFHSGGQCGAD
jgi:hypothetical protein